MLAIGCAGINILAPDNLGRQLSPIGFPRETCHDELSTGALPILRQPGATERRAYFEGHDLEKNLAGLFSSVLDDIITRRGKLSIIANLALSGHEQGLANHDNLIAPKTLANIIDATADTLSGSSRNKKNSISIHAYSNVPLVYGFGGDRSAVAGCLRALTSSIDKPNNGVAIPVRLFPIVQLKVPAHDLDKDRLKQYMENPENILFYAQKRGK
jgi:hypothetical protein